MTTACLFCGGDSGAPDHRTTCDGRQGRAEASADVRFHLGFGEYHAPVAAGSDTSAAAGHSIEPTAESLCGQIFAALKQERQRGLTCSEVETRFELRHQTASARIWDLRTRGFIVDSGTRRPSSSGRASIVWVITGNQEERHANAS